jgi:hypothetical protein
MTDLPERPPLAEAASIDSEISTTTHDLFRSGDGRSGDLRRLQMLIERRAALLAPPAPPGVERLRATQKRLRASAEALRVSSLALAEG